MESRLVKLKGDFNNIITIRNTVKNVFDILQVRIDKLRTFYTEFIKNRKTEMFVFGLDSFHFQSKLIDIEYEDMKRLFLAINNRMYCEYFKLHRIIVDYISKGITEKVNIDMTKVNNYPVYKDLEPFREYKFETILDIHENILNLLGILMSVLTNKENELSIHKSKQTLGLNIDNFITTFNFNINVMREKITMFITYIEFFHKLHSKYLKRFSNKIQLMYTHVNNDIKFDDSVEISKNKKQELIDEFNATNVDKKLLNDLKKSIGSDTTGSDLESEEGVDNISNQLLLDIKERTSSRESNLSAMSMNIGELPSTPTNRNRNIRDVFKRNVNKVSNMLQLCKPKQNKLRQASITDNDLQKMFNGIEDSCNSIINEEPVALIEGDVRENINVILEEESNEEVSNIQDSEVVDEIVNEVLLDEQEKVDEGEKIEQEEKVEQEEQEQIMEEVKEEEKIEDGAKEDEKEEQVEEENIVVEKVEEEPQQVEKVEEVATNIELQDVVPKKKRQYNRKKKQ